MFLLAGTAQRRLEHRPRVLELLELVDFERLAGILAGRRLLPLMGARLEALGPDRLPQTFCHEVGAATQRDRARAIALKTLTRQLTTRLESAGVRTLVLKGPLMAEALHGDPGLRAAFDIDLLVDLADVPEAIQLLGLEGYRTGGDGARTGRIPELHWVLWHERLPRLDLHWRVHWYERTFSRDMLKAAADDHERLRRPLPEDELASLLLYFARDGFVGLRLAADIGAWWDSRTPHPDAPILASRMRDHPELSRAWMTAARVSERFTGVPARRLLAPNALDRRSGLAVRLADWSQQGDPAQHAANASLIDGLLSPPRGRTSFLRRRLLPPEATLAPPGSEPVGWRALAATPVHAAKTAARYVIALWTVRAGRVLTPVPIDRRCPEGASRLGAGDRSADPG